MERSASPSYILSHLSDPSLAEELAARKPSIKNFLYKSYVKVVATLSLPLEYEHTKRDFNYSTAVRVIQALQIISLITSCDLRTEQYAFWTVLRYSRIDWLFHKNLSLWMFWITAMSFAAIQLCAFILAIVTSLHYPKAFHVSCLILKRTFNLTFDILVIPFQTILIVIEKCSLTSQVQIPEYESASATEFTGNLLACIASMMTCFTLLAFQLMKLYFLNRIQIAAKSPYSLSKLSVRQDVETAIGYFAIVFHYATGGLYSPLKFKASFIGLGSYLAMQYIRRLPDTNKRVSWQVMSLQLIAIWVAVSSIIEDRFGNISTSFILSLLVSPTFLCISHALLEKRYLQLNKGLAKPMNTVKFLFNFRGLAFDRDISQRKKLATVIEKFATFRKESTQPISKMLDIHEVLFCLEYLKDERLALIKLCNLNRPGFAVEAWLMELRIRCYLESRGAKWEEVEYLKFINELQKVKALDLEVSLVYYRLWNELSQGCPDNSKIGKFIKKLRRSVSKVRGMYENLLYSFPENKHVFDLYCSFLSMVLNVGEQDKVVSVLKLRYSMKAELHSNMDNFSCFGKGHGVLIISADAQNFAKIMYANEEAHGIFRLSKDLLLGRNINDFIPKPASIGHTEKMQAFVSNCNKTTIKMPFNSFFLDSTGYLMSCSLVIKLTSLAKKPVFLVSLLERPKKNELAILDDSGRILAHSKNLHKVFGVPNKNLETIPIESLIPISLSELEAFQVSLAKMPHGEVKFSLVNFLRLKEKFKLLFFFTDSTEFMRWRQGNNLQDIRELTKPYSNKLEILNATSIVSRSVIKTLSNISTYGNTQPVENDDSSGVDVISKSGCTTNDVAFTKTMELKRTTCNIAKFNKFTVSLKIPRLAALICAIATLGGSICMQVTMVLTLNQVNKVSVLETLDQVTTEMASLGLCSKLIYLNKFGVSLYDNDTLEMYLTTTLSSLRENSIKLVNDRELFQHYGFDEIYSQDYLLDWKLTHYANLSLSAVTKTNLVDALQTFVMCSDNYAKGGSLDLLYHNYRNGLGENFIKVNTTIADYLEKQDELIEAFELNMLIILVMSSSIYAACFIVVLLSTFAMQKDFSRFLNTFIHLNADHAMHLNFEIKERLRNYFDPSTIEELETIPRLEVRQCSKVSHLPAINISLLKPFNVLLGVFFIIVLSMAISYYQVVFKNLQNSLSVYTERVYITSQLKLGSLNVAAWVVETRFDQDPEVLFTLKDRFPSAKWELHKALSAYKFQFEKLYNAKFDEVEFDLKPMLRNDFGSAMSYFNYGLQPAIVILHQEISAYTSISPTDEELRKLLLNSFEVSNHEVKVVESVFKGREATIDARLKEANMIGLGFCIGIVLISIVISRMMESLKAEILSIKQIIKKIV
mmetsp:Transcript_23822/g.42177  ORF Transcript_23822/g.42177 Transcript_23822/m.42177 type:complete len:1382 (-) Transcript_23822:30-4175(-)